MQGRHGGTTVRQTGRGDPGAGSGLRCGFPCSGVPHRGHLGSRNPARKLALSWCQGLWGTHWTRRVWGDTVSLWGLGGHNEPAGSGGTGVLSRPRSSACERPGNKDVPLVAGGEHPLSGTVLILGVCSEVPGGLQGPLKNREISDFCMF